MKSCEERQVPVAASLWRYQTWFHTRVTRRARAPSLAPVPARRAYPLPPYPSARFRPLLRTRRVHHQDSTSNLAPLYPSPPRRNRTRRARAFSLCAEPSASPCCPSPFSGSPLASGPRSSNLSPAANRPALLRRRTQPHRPGPHRPHPHPPAAHPAGRQPDADPDQWDEPGTPSTSLDLPSPPSKTSPPTPPAWFPSTGRIRATLLANGTPQTHNSFNPTANQTPAPLRRPRRNHPPPPRARALPRSRRMAVRRLSPGPGNRRHRQRTRPPNSCACVLHTLTRSLTCLRYSMPHLRRSKLGRRTPSRLHWSAANRRLPPQLRLTPDDAGMVNAMLFGDRSRLTQQLRLGFQRRLIPPLRRLGDARRSARGPARLALPPPASAQLARHPPHPHPHLTLTRCSQASAFPFSALS